MDCNYSVPSHISAQATHMFFLLTGALKSCRGKKSLFSFLSRWILTILFLLYLLVFLPVLRIRIGFSSTKAKMVKKERKKVRNFMFWSVFFKVWSMEASPWAWKFFMEALEIGCIFLTLQMWYVFNNFFLSLVIKTLGWIRITKANFQNFFYIVWYSKTLSLVSDLQKPWSGSDEFKSETLSLQYLAIRSENMRRVCAVPRSHIQHAAPGSRQARHTRTNCWRSVTHSVIFVVFFWVRVLPGMPFTYHILFVIKGTVALE
jgi:hypothetical protein